MWGDGDGEVSGGNDSAAAPRFVYQLFIDHDEISLNCHVIFFLIKFASATFKQACKQRLLINQPIKAPIPLKCGQ